jgi:hypothetical protein
LELEPRAKILRKKESKIIDQTDRLRKIDSQNNAEK